MQIRDKFRYFTTLGCSSVAEQTPSFWCSCDTFSFFVLMPRCGTNSPRYQGETVVCRPRHFAAFGPGLEHLSP